MRNFILITRREYLNKIKNKTFILSTILTPLFIVGVILFIGWLTSLNNETIKNISVVDKTGKIFNKLQSSGSLKFELLDDFSFNEAKIISETKSDYGLLYIKEFDYPKTVADSISFITEGAASFSIINNIESQLENILTNENFKIEGIDIDKINKSRVDVSLFQQTYKGEKTTKEDGAVKLIFGLIIRN